MFGYRKLAQRLLTIAWPAVGEMMLYMMIGFVDVAMVGRLGPGPLTSVTLGAEIFFVIMMFLAAFGMGGMIMVAQATGAGQAEKVSEVAGQVILLALGLGLVISGPLYFNIPRLVGLFPVEADVYQMVVDYLRITVLIAPCVLCLYMGNGIFRGIGRTGVPLALAAVSNVINICGDYVLVFGKWGFPALGATGAAVATTVAHLVAFFLLLLIMVRGSFGVKLSLNSVFLPRFRIIKEIFHLGLPAAVEDLVRGGGGFISSYFLARLGTVAFAAHQIAITVESVSFMPAYGFAIAATALVGQSLGARRVREAWASAYTALVFAGLIMGTAGIVFYFFPGYVAFLFTSDRELVSMASLCIKIAAVYQLALGLEMVLAGALRGAGDTRTPMIVSLVGIWLIRIPGLWLIVERWHLGLNAVWWLIAIDWFFRGLVMLFIFMRGRWLAIRVNV